MPGGYNFFSPFFQAVLTSPEGTEVLPLWQGPTPKDAAKFGFKSTGQPLAEALAIASSLTVDLMLGGFFELKLELRPTYNDALTLLASTAIVQGMSLIQVRFGYISGGGQIISPWLTGLVMEPDFTIGTEFTLNLKATAVTGSMLRRSSSVGVVFRDKTRVEILRELVKGPGGDTPPCPLTLNTSRVTGAEELKLLTEEKTSIEAGAKNYLVQISEVLNQCFCSYLITDDPDKKGGDQILWVLDRKARFDSVPKRIFRLFGPQSTADQKLSGVAGVYGGDGNGGGVFPILSIASQSKQIFLPGVTGGFIRPKFDEATKAAAEKKPEDIDKTSPAPNVGPAASENKKVVKGVKGKFNSVATAATGAGGAAVVGDSESKPQEAKMRADMYKSSLDAGIQLDVTSLGVPDMEPGEVIIIQGLGVRIDGTYAVHKLTHTIGSGGFETKFSCISNGGFIQQTAAGTVKESVVQTNTKTPESGGPVVTGKDQGK